MKYSLFAMVAVFVGGCSASSGTGSSSESHDAVGAPRTATANVTGRNSKPENAGVYAAVSQLLDVQTKLPPLPEMTNVVAAQREDSVGIDFDPVDGAVDYRVYPLPADVDINVGADGSVIIPNAVYRCAGLRQTYDVANDQNSGDSSLVTSGGYAFHTSFGQNPTLGYVYPTPGSGRSPVYVLAGFQDPDDKNWRESRFKIYTTDVALRQSLVEQGWRNDKVAFYVPTQASGGTQTVYGSQQTVNQGNGFTNYDQFYFLDADLATHASDTTPPSPAFQVLTNQEDGSVPLMAVTYLESDQHVELLAGNERFQRAAKQGIGPLWHVEWSGITAPTTLVVEALSSGCPYQGFLAPTHLSAPPHQTFNTLADLAAASPSGEVFVNGQYDTTSFPRAVARSFISVAPKPHNPTDFDFYEGFSDGSLGTVTPVATSPDCYQCGRWQSDRFDFGSYLIDQPNGVPVFTYGTSMGALWTAYDDAGQDVAAKVRFTAKQTATAYTDPTMFIHATVSFDIVSTDRRYPQLIISDQPAPVQEGLSNPNNNTLLLQTMQGPTMMLEAQAIHGLVNGSPWDVNNQQPGAHDFVGSKSDVSMTPADPLFEHAGMDRLTRVDLYVSSARMYSFVDGMPAGCSLLPSDFVLSGPVTVTIGDVLYHEGASDEQICSAEKPYSFMHSHQCTETKRHFDDFGFKSGEPAPAWDEAKFPCLPY